MDTNYEFGIPTQKKSVRKELMSQLNSIMSTIDRRLMEAESNEKYLVTVSHRTFDKEFKPIRPYLKYHTVNPPVHRTPADECRTLVFYHPSWPQMPVAQITEQFLCGMTTKEYYLNPGYCRVLRSMTNENPNSESN